jgi:hypothetical protein
MSKYIKQLTQVVMLTLFAVTLAGCGGGSDGTLKADLETPLICKLPNTINAAGTGCEFIPSLCNYPEVDNGAGSCMMDMNEWIPGSNDIDMPVPEYVVGAGEVVLYWALASGEYTDWGLHAWNNDTCNSYSDFNRPEGGTDWTAPIAPTGIDPNFGAYWVMSVIEQPNCINFIPHNLEADAQTGDLMAELFTAEHNPTGSFFVIESHQDLVFGYPRTLASLVVPGGGTLQCEAPLVLNDAGDECIDDPTALEVFVPGEAVLYARGSFNDWENQDAYAFSYADNIYTMVVHLEASADVVEFKIADANWSDPTSFGTLTGEEDVLLGEAKTLTVTEAQNIKMTVSEASNYQLTFDATDPEAPVLTVIQVVYDQVMYVKGSMNEWSNTDAMTYESEGVYTLEYTLDAGDYEFKVADANWTEATNFGATEGDEALTLGEPKSLVFGEGIAMNIALSITEAGSYNFTLDASVPEAPVLTVVNAVPYGDKVLYLKGTMNEWGGNLDGFGLAYADNHYTLTRVLPAGAHEFKIADPDWLDASTMGALPGEGAVVLGEAKTLTLPGDDNLTLELTQDTLISIDVDATDKNAPVLTISQHVAFAGRTIYLKGTMNDWGGELTGFEFVANAAGVYTLDVTLPVAAYEFKIADADWQDDSTVGAVTGSEVLTLGEANTLTLPGDGNLTLDITEEKEYTFTLDAAHPVMPVLTVVGL